MRGHQVEVLEQIAADRRVDVTEKVEEGVSQVHDYQCCQAGGQGTPSCIVRSAQESRTIRRTRFVFADLASCS